MLFIFLDIRKYIAVLNLEMNMILFLSEQLADLEQYRSSCYATKREYWLLVLNIRMKKENRLSFLIIMRDVRENWSCLLKKIKKGNEMKTIWKK